MGLPRKRGQLARPQEMFWMGHVPPAQAGTLETIAVVLASGNRRVTSRRPHSAGYLLSASAEDLVVTQRYTWV